MTVQTKQQQIEQKIARLKWLRKQCRELEQGASKKEKEMLKFHSLHLQMRIEALDR